MIGPSKACERVADRDRGVGEGAGIDDDAPRALAAAMDPVDDLVFPVALMELDRELELRADPPAVRLDIGQRLAAVDLRLALAEQIEIGAVENGDDSAHALDPFCPDHGRRAGASPDFSPQAIANPLAPAALK